MVLGAHFLNEYHVLMALCDTRSGTVHGAVLRRRNFFDSGTAGGEQEERFVPNTYCEINYTQSFLESCRNR
jgi:hypothetical protein